MAHTIARCAQRQKDERRGRGRNKDILSDESSLYSSSILSNSGVLNIAEIRLECAQNSRLPAPETQWVVVVTLETVDFWSPGSAGFLGSTVSAPLYPTS
jgi:hypothetical protein